MATIVITGLPGVGKTRVALALAARLAADREVRLLHTDVLKHWLRRSDPRFPAGPGWRACGPKLVRARPFLLDQAEEARREGFVLVVEGTLAVGFAPPAGFVVRLTLDEGERARRVAAKPPDARAALAAGGALRAYRALLEEAPAALALDAGPAPEALAETIMAAWAGAGVSAVRIGGN